MKRQTVLSCGIITIVLAIIISIQPAIAGENDEYTLGYTYFQGKEYLLAKDQFKSFLQEYPQSDKADDARFLMGECAFRTEAFDEAIGHYQQLINEYPASPLRLDAVRGVATTWFHQGKYEEAIKGYEQVIKQSNDAPVISQSLYQTGESYDNLGLYQKAVEYYDRVLTDYPKSAEAQDALYAKGWGLYRLQEYQAAYDALTRFIERAPNHNAVAEASYRAAESLFKLEDWTNAQKAYQKVISTYANDEAEHQLLINARFRLGECYFQQRLMAEAKKTFNLLLHEQGTSSIAAEAQYWIAEILLEQQKYTEAIHEYQKVVDLYPKSDIADDAQYGIGMAHFLQEEYAKARGQFKNVADNLRSDLTDAARFRIGECFRLQREFNSAILNYERVKQRSSYYDDALYGIATSAFELRDYTEAIRTLNSLLQSYQSSPLKPYAYYQLGLNYYYQEVYEKSVEALDRFLTEKGDADLEIAPTDEALFWKARALYELEEYQATIQTCERLIQGFPSSSLRFRATFFIAESTYWSEQTPKAFQSARQKYQNLLKEEPTSEWAEKCRYGIGWTHFSEATLLSGRPRTTHYQDSIKAWREVLQHHPHGEFSDKAQFQIGIAYVNLKQYDDAISSFKEVLYKHPDSDWLDNTQYQIGQVHYKQENYAEAIVVFDEMLRKHPGSSLVSKAIFGKGNAYFKQGKYAQAIENYQSVVDKFPNQKLPIRDAGAEPIHDLRHEAQYYIAESFLNLQNYTKAIRAYENVIKHYPASDWADDAQYGIAVAYENMRQKEKAMQAYRTLMKKYPGRELAPDVQVKIADFYYQNGDHTRAIAEYQKVINQYANSLAVPFAQYKIGECYIALVSYQEAIRAFEKVPPDTDFAPVATYQIGHALYDPNNPGRNLGRAVNALLQVHQKYPQSPDAPRALLLTGQCYEELVEWNKAAEIYRRIIKDYTNSRQAKVAQLLLGHALREQEMFAEALKAYDVIRKAGTQQYPHDIVIEATLHKAETQALTGAYYEAGRTYLRIPTLSELRQHNPLMALQASIRAGDAFAKVKDTTKPYKSLAKDEYQNAIEFYKSHISTVQDPKIKKDWDKLHDIAQTRLEQLLKEIGQE